MLYCKLMSTLAEVIQKAHLAPHTLGEKDVPGLRAANLGGYVRPRLPVGHPLREALRTDFLSQSTRHALIRAELRSLLEVWTQAGIPALLMKGFALAEFDYDSPGERFYGDVDLLIPNDPDVIARAVHLAIAHGWRSDGQHAHPGDWTHECAHLYGPGGHIKLDVHRFVSHWWTGSQRRVKRLTNEVWDAAMPVDWAGLTVLRPSPTDQVIVNLALGRAWGDAGGVKAADFADLQLLQSKHGLDPGALARRAQEMRGTHTWAGFQAVCQPDHPEHAAALQGKSATLRLAAQQDGVLNPTRLWEARLRRLPAMTFWMLRLLPDVLAAARAYRHNGDPRANLHRWARPVSGRLQRTTQGQIISAARWWIRLLYPRQAKRGTCLPRAYATYHALRRYGHPAVFVSGVARTGASVTSHAWVEDDRGVMEAYGEPLVRLRFTETFRMPSHTRMK